MSLPAADELFRTTGGSAVQPSAPQQQGEGRQGGQGQVNGEAAKVPAQATEPEPGGGTPQEHASAGEGDGETGAGAGAGNGGEHGGRETRNPSSSAASASPASTGRTEEQRAPAASSAAPQQQGASGGRGSAKGRQSSGGSSARRRAASRRPSGRERHDEKITVYVSAEELMDLEHARLVLRGEHGLAVDRGRIVREAVAVVLADLESRGDASILVRRLRGR
ncbi:hypothetical protein GCM10009801_39580 [Streptomyces albiaxialis]|uniref:Uncharacterized protein n=1 Tax=Streptomyces albiaxialis TaxID=329523 RepID=A0ABN2W1T7_9ACTN